MQTFIPFSKQLLLQFVNKLPGDIKIGDNIELVEENENWKNHLTNSFAQFVIVNIPEDIGTKNVGILTNSKNVFPSLVRQFVNLQDNLYLHGGDILLFGSINTDDIEDQVNLLSVDKDKLTSAVEQLDERVYNIIKAIFETGKIPIIIGGGQNNSFPILRALSEVKNNQVNCLNIGAHTGLRDPEDRHARNPFSFALVDDYLDKYYAFGLHESEIPHSIYEFIIANYGQIGFTRFEAILKNDPYLFEAIQEANEFVQGKPFGLEINLNSVSDIILSPDYPDGFLLREIRQILRKVCLFHQPAYLHICEAKSGKKGSQEEKIVGKSLALLVSDFIKGFNHSTEEEE